MAKIYCADTSEPITPKVVRDSIVECFFLAHKEVLDEMDEYAKGMLPEELRKAKRKCTEDFIRKSFEKVGGDFDKPTKESILRVLDVLREFAANFRKPEVIKKHYNEIMQLVKMLEDERLT